MKINSILAVFGVIVVSACGGTPSIEAVETTVTVTAPPVTVTEPLVTVTEQADPVPATTVTVTEQVEVPAAPAAEDAVLQEQVMQTTWDQLSLSDQVDMCMGWDIEEFRPQLLDTLISGAGGMLDRGIAEDFFNKVCP